MNQYKLFFIILLFTQTEDFNCAETYPVRAKKIPESKEAWRDLKDLINKNDSEKFEKLLIQNKDIINYQDKFGMTLLMIAAANGRFEICEILVQMGANINLKNDYSIGRTAYWLAVNYEHKEIIELLDPKKKK